MVLGHSDRKGVNMENNIIMNSLADLDRSSMSEEDKISLEILGQLTKIRRIDILRLVHRFVSRIMENERIPG